MGSRVGDASESHWNGVPAINAMDNQKHITVFGIGSCLDCGRTFVVDTQSFAPVDFSICRDCIDKINDLRSVDGLPPIGNKGTAA